MNKKKRSALADVVATDIVTAASATRNNRRYMKKSTMKNLLTN